MKGTIVVINPMAIGAGAAAGVIGAGVWAAIAYFTQYEIGWIAWGIGAGVGGAMYVVAKDRSLPLGIAAVLITVLAICAGKYASVELLFGSAVGDVDEWVARLEQEDVLIASVAAEVAEEMEADGKELQWPEVDFEDESLPERAYYPTVAWEEAERRWAEMDAADRQAFKLEKQREVEESADELEEFRSLVGWEMFKASFGLMDIVFFGLAVVTAFKITGSAESD